MKISKVNHTKTCISVRKRSFVQADSPGAGMLYQHPADGRTGKADIDDPNSYIAGKLNQNAKRLYSLFIPCDAEAKRERDAFRIEKKFFDAWAKQYLFCEKSYVPPLKEDEKKTISKYVSKKAISSFVNGWLRNSLRRNVRLDNGEKIDLPSVLAEMMYLAIAGKNEVAIAGKNVMEIRQKIGDEIFDKVAAFVREDYTKEKRIEKITASIEKKNTKVQVAIKNGMPLLQLSNADHETKKHVFRWIREYAASDDMRQKQMLCQIRKLILAFFCGKEGYDRADDANVSAWSFGRMEFDDSNPFSADAVERIGRIASAGKAAKAEKRKHSDDLKSCIRDEIAAHYREAVEIPDIKENQAALFWVQYFERFAEKELHVQNSLDPGKLSLRHLCSAAWREWVSFIAMKYVDMGKAVYHFAMPDLDDAAVKKRLKIGAVQPAFQKGISSFSYERIAAKESLERDLTRYISFAVNNFSKTVCSEEFRAKHNNEDLLTVKNPELLPDLRHKILQYFGGASAWTGDKKITKYTDMELFCTFRDKLFDLRNATFHYAGKMNDAAIENSEIISDLLGQELSRVGNIYRKKYYSNNALMFYREIDVTKLMNRLYGKTHEVLPAQIPAFHHMINKANLDEVIAGLIEPKHSPLGKADEITVNFKGAFFFILKEIYYHDFLMLKDLPKRFFDSFDKAPADKVENREALNDFRKRLKAIQYWKLSFGEICQYIMTDYNQQNSDQKKHVSAKEKTVVRDGKQFKTVREAKDDGQKYKHFRSLLYLGIKNTFLIYIKEDRAFDFLRLPEYQEDIYERISEDKFCSGWNCPMYDAFMRSCDPMLQSYYVCAHFLNPKYLNHMAGCIKNYIQYRKDIDRRAKSTNHTANAEEVKALKEEVKRYEEIVKMLEFCLLFSGQTSGEILDYFDSEDAYVAYMEKWIQYDDAAASGHNRLKAFCEEEIETAGKKRKIGTYYDEKNPILNRNIVMAKLYGDTHVISSCFHRISKEEFKEYYEKADALETVFRRGNCETADEQKRLREYQNLKNRIEMVDVSTYSELVNDLLGQLISWAYLRERDLMYLQLGYYYIKLYHTDSVPEDHWMRQLKGDSVDLADGAILYQIAAMYTFEFPVYELRDGQAYAPETKSSTGSNVTRFLKKYCQGDNQSERDSVYTAGLCFFEDVERQHDELVELRNYIDHFKYSIRRDQSLLELYSKLYDSFLAYDTKLRKSVTFTLKNILLQYFVDAKLTMAATKTVDAKRDRTYHRTDIRIAEGALSSDYFSCKLAGGKKGKSVFVKVREDRFLEQLREILMYQKP